MSKRPSLEQHKIVAQKLHEISDAVVFLTAMFETATSYKVGKHLESLDTITKKFRYEMEGQLFKDVPSEINERPLYYSRKRSDDERPIDQGLAAGDNTGLDF